MIRIFKEYNPIAIILILLINFILWFNIFNSNFEVFKTTDELTMPFFRYIENLIQNSGIPQLKYIISCILIILHILLIVSIENTYALGKSKGFLIVLIYVVLTTAYLPYDKFHPVLFSNIFILLGISKIFKSYGVKKATYLYFDTSLLFALAALFYIQSAILFIFIIVAISIIRPYKFNEMASATVGFATPFIVYLAVYFIVFGQITTLTELVKNIFSQKLYLPYKLENIIFYSIVILTLLRCNFHIIKNFPQFNLANRNYFKVLFWLFNISIITVIIFPFCSFMFFYISIIPFTFLITYYFQSLKSKLWGEISFVIFIFLYIASQYFYYKQIYNI